MPKRKFEDDCDDVEDGPATAAKPSSTPNCYTMVVSTERLEKAQKTLQSLVDCKTKLENELEKYLEQIEHLVEKILELECKAEKMLQDIGAKECMERFKSEIICIKEAKCRAEEQVNKYRTKLSSKLKKMKHFFKKINDDV